MYSKIVIFYALIFTGCALGVRRQVTMSASKENELRRAATAVETARKAEEIAQQRAAEKAAKQRQQEEAQQQAQEAKASELRAKEAALPKHAGEVHYKPMVKIFILTSLALVATYTLYKVNNLGWWAISEDAQY